MTKYSGIFFPINYKTKTGEEKTKWHRAGDVFSNEKSIGVNLYNFINFSNLECNNKELGTINLRIFTNQSDTGKNNLDNDDDIPF